MTLWFLLALMTAAAAFAVLWPLARRPGEKQSGSDVVVYRDQLEEVARDRAAGLIDATEAAAAEIEISRRIITATDAQPRQALIAAPARRRAVAVAALVLMPLCTAALYLTLGSPSLPDQPLAERLGTARENQSLDRLVTQVEAHLQQSPDDARGWEVIAPVYIRLGRFEDAVKARREVLRLRGPSAEGEAALGEALVYAANGVVTAEAKSAFDRAVSLDAASMQARYFLGVAAEQDGNRAQAAAIWREMIQTAPPGAAWVEFVSQALARVEGKPRPGPGEEQIAASSDLTPEQRGNMVRGMVARLAERLAEDGSDLDGWVRLVRSYMVLGEPDKARAAVLDARHALGADPGKLRQLDEAVKGLGLDG
ncbi:MAG: c-type cytochrome biogenesis protein CcmI [Xanthobacteraceae bacterium]